MAEERAEQRREALKIIGAISATCAFPFSADELYGQQAEHEHPVAGKSAPMPPAKYFKPEQMEMLGVIAGLIIPATDTPSAKDAGVASYIDLVVSGNPNLQRTFSEGLPWIEKQTTGRKFIALTENEQLAILEPLCEAVDQSRINTAGERWFRAMKSLVADGYYTSRVGMVDELGYKGGSVLSSYPECLHEH